jgi:hypothetical protein
MIDIAAILMAVCGAIGGLAVGSVLHELTHWVVLRAAGRSPRYRLPRPQNGQLTHGVEFTSPRETPWDIRLAAAAPVITGGAILAVIIENWRVFVDPVALFVAVVIAIQAARLSDADIRVIRS